MWPRAAVGRLSSAVPVPLGAFSPGLRSLGGGAPGCSVRQPCGTAERKPAPHSGAGGGGQDSVVTGGKMGLDSSLRLGS